MTTMSSTTAKKKKKTSNFAVIMKRLLHNPTAMVGLVILLVLILASIFGPYLTPYDINQMDFTNMFGKPSLAHPFGTDELGRDIFTRCLYGGRYSLSLGFLAAISSTLVGLLIGTYVGYKGGQVDMVAMRLCDIIGAIPGNLLAILISTTLGAGFVNTIIAMTVGGIAGRIRGVRAMCLKEREAEYLEAALSINCSKAKILYKHMLPNIISPEIVGTTMAIGLTIMSAAGLAYIGLGVQPPTPEWGAMLAGARDYILDHSYMLFFPGMCIALTVFGINLFGDGLRDALDPKLKD